MIKKGLIGALLAVTCLVTACSSQGGAPNKEADQAVSAQQDSEKLTQETADTADTEQASEAAAEQAADGTSSEAAAPANGSAGMYEDERGWYVLYDQELFTVESEKDGVKFHYTGEAVGDNYVEIRYIPDKQPREILTEEVEELVEEWEPDEDEMIRDEGFLFEDKWCYTAVVRYSEDERDTTVQLQSAEFNGGVILTKMVVGMTDENILEGSMNDSMWNILDSLTFYDYQPQTELDYVPGIYSLAETGAEAPERNDAENKAGGADTTEEATAAGTADGEETAAEMEPEDSAETAAEAAEAETDGAEADGRETENNAGTEQEAVDPVNQIILKKDHTGSLVSQDAQNAIQVLWGSTLLTEKNTERTYEYTIEGDSLYLNLNGKWCRYDKTEEIEEIENRLDDPEYLDRLNGEIDTLYHDAEGRTGRIHKMQAFILELALHAKSQNPDFKIIGQNAPFLAYNDGTFEKGDQSYMKDLVDGWGAEGIVGKDKSLTPSVFQRIYVDQVKKGKFVSDTTTVQSEEQLANYLARANAWGIIPYPKLGGELAQEVLPGQRWANNGDYFWVEDPSKLGIEDRFDGKRDVKNLTDARTYLYNINGRPYDNWKDWDKEEKEFEKGDGDRTRILDSYSCGLLIPSKNGKYTPVGDDPEEVAEIVNEYGDKWDWWWREAGLDEDAGRETWLNAIRNSDYDVVFIDSFYNHRARPENQTPLTPEEVESLKTKPDGGRRQVISYLAIGTAEQNRWYCQDDWIWVDPKNKNSFYSMKAGKVRERGTNSIYIPFKDSISAKSAENTAEPPSWLAFDFGDDYPEEAVVQWWHKDWRDIIINGGSQYAHKTTGDNTSSIDRILAQGFDGVYLDNIDSCIDSNWEAFDAYWKDHGGIPE